MTCVAAATFNLRCDLSLDHLLTELALVNTKLLIQSPSYCINATLHTKAVILKVAPGMLSHRTFTYGSNGSPRCAPFRTRHICIFRALLFHYSNFKKLHFADSYRTFPILRGRAAITPSISFLPFPIRYLR